MATKPPMFQVFLSGKRMFSTDSPSCMPDKETISAMKKAGYKVKMTKEK